MDPTYMDHPMARRLVNLPRVMMRHMSYVISMKDHELPYGDWLTMVFEEFGKMEFGGWEVERTGEEMMIWIIRKKRREKEDEGNKDGFDWEAMIDEAVVEGNTARERSFMIVVDKDQGSPEVQEEIQRATPQSLARRKNEEASGVDPSCPTGRILEAKLLKFQAEFERKRANKFHADLEKAKAENARLLALLHQAQFKPNP
ncbi:hypothetical protein Dimus_033420 [Dionaea muscipula]